MQSVGVSGDGVRVALIDTGYDTGNAADIHPDVRGRVTIVGAQVDRSGHGTHIGGIIAAGARLTSTSGNPITDANDFLMGLGVAPASHLVVCSDQQQAVAQHAVASNNSYALRGRIVTDPAGTPRRIASASAGYHTDDMDIDKVVRDAEDLIVVFSVGNCGDPNASPTTCFDALGGNHYDGPTKEAKNVIAVGATENRRDDQGRPFAAGNIDAVANFSSRGFTQDGRVYPHVVAPGDNIISTKSSRCIAGTGNRPWARRCLAPRRGKR